MLREQWDSRRGLERHGVMLRGRGRSVKLYSWVPRSREDRFMMMATWPDAWNWNCVYTRGTMSQSALVSHEGH